MVVSRILAKVYILYNFYNFNLRVLWSITYTYTYEYYTRTL